MAFTKITAAGIGSTETVTLDGLSVINDVSIGGTVSIAGTLTYEDVTNVDSVGLITARNGIVVGSGITLSKDGDVFFTGIITGNGSGLTNLATDLVNDTTPQLGGNLDVNTKNIVFGDSGGATDDRLTFGAGTDLSIYHDGSHSRIDETGTGNLMIQSDNAVFIKKGTSENIAVFNADGAVDLYHDNSKKFETNASGVIVTGNIVGTSFTASGPTGQTAFVNQHAVGVGSTSTTGKFAGVGTDAGTIVFDVTKGTLEFFNGSNWIATSAQQPALSSITGNLIDGNASTLTLAGEGFGSANLIVKFVQSSDSIDTTTTVTPSSSTAASVAVPAAVYNNVTAGNVVTITVTNADGLESSGVTHTAIALPSGGTVTTSGNYRIHSFTSSGTFVNTLASLSVEYLVIAGGGGGGVGDLGAVAYGGGGGAGGYRTNVAGQTSGGGASAEAALSLSTGNKTVTVGAGGANASGDNQLGTAGGDSVFDSITSIGGGRGGANTSTPTSGGSGGGGEESNGSGAAGTSGQGYAGGTGSEGGNRGGGGGGAGSAGGTTTGGNGVSSNITGSAVTRAGGGGSNSSGGSGGGGAGGAGGTAGTAGTANTGSGGGAGTVTSGAGGSGIVIVRYLVTGL